MAEVEQLLKYQEEDSKLLKLEREVSQSEERKNFVQVKNYLTKAPEKLEAMDSRAREMFAALDKLNKTYEEIAETLNDFENLDELVEGGADISFYKKNATQMAEKLKAIKNEIAALQKSMKAADEEYRAFKKKTIEMQDKFQESQKIYREYKNSKRAESENIQKRLDEIAKNIEPKVLAAYNAKRNEQVFPIICAVSHDRCPKCGTELSIVGKDKVASGKVTECEYCHRFLYNAEKLKV